MPVDRGAHEGAGPRNPNVATYVSGERVFGPPVGTFDVEWVARQVERETAASFDVVHAAVAQAWTAARRAGSLAPDLLAQAAGSVGATADISAAVTTYVSAYCDTYGVDPVAR
jgi:hypothetical protein